MSSLQEAQKLAATLSANRDKLSALFLSLQVSIDAAKAAAMTDIKRTARQVAASHAALVAFISENPDMFNRPRSHVVDGIKFGMQASQGTLEWENDEKVCERIIALAEKGEIPADQVDLLISVTKKPVASAVRQLDPALQRRIGVRLEGVGDQPLIKNVDSNVEKAVQAVINAAIKEANLEAG